MKDAERMYAEAKRLHYELGDLDGAQRVYREIKRRFPGTKYAEWARMRIITIDRFRDEPPNNPSKESEDASLGDRPKASDLSPPDSSPMWETSPAPQDLDTASSAIESASNDPQTILRQAGIVEIFAAMELHRGKRNVAAFWTVVLAIAVLWGGWNLWLLIVPGATGAYALVRHLNVDLLQRELKSRKESGRPGN